MTTCTSLNSLACRTSAAFTGSICRRAATDMDIPRTSVTGSCALACSRYSSCGHVIGRRSNNPLTPRAASHSVHPLGQSSGGLNTGQH